MNKIYIPLSLMDFSRNMDETFLKSIHSVKDLKSDIGLIFSDIEIVHHKKARQEYDLLNVSCAFDIETTSTYINEDGENKKLAFMYVWQMMLNGYIIMGRTWEELTECFSILKEALNLDTNVLRLPIYVHNLGYEFQFMRKYFEIDDFFATDKRTPVRFCIDGIEFRDSLILSGYSLANLNKAMVAKVYKKEGDLKYDLTRHILTPLTDEEILYCIYDVYVLSVYIYEKIINGENVNKIPFTKTGYVRNLTKKECLRESNYSQKIKTLTIEPEEYLQLKKTYQGGFTHANTFLVDETLKNVASNDFTSSYPTVLIAEKYPMSKGKKAKLIKSENHGDKAIARLEKISKDYCFMCSVLIEDLEQKITHECYLSKSKCDICVNAIVENGRISKADKVVTYITDVDLEIIKQAYKWSNIYFTDLVIYKKAYLPKELIKIILNLYEAKTKLKDVEGKELEYQKAKEMINSIYGMMCQDPLQDINEYIDNEWTFEKVDLYEGIEKYNNSKTRTTFYPWGVWCCAYARRNLWLSGIIPLGNDYIYSDTDSVKYLNPEKHTKLFSDYNKEITKKLFATCKWYHIDPIKTHPSTIDGKEKPLGVWDHDGDYNQFKTLGAKRYLVETTDGEIKPTIAGLPKKKAKKFFEKQENPFKTFSAGDKKNPLKVPKEDTGKNVLTYVDEEHSGYIKDYKGNTLFITSKSYIHMEKTSFNLSLSSDFISIIGEKKTKKLI